MDLHESCPPWNTTKSLSLSLPSSTCLFPHSTSRRMHHTASYVDLVENVPGSAPLNLIRIKQLLWIFLSLPVFPLAPFSYSSSLPSPSSTLLYPSSFLSLSWPLLCHLNGEKLSARFNNSGEYCLGNTFSLIRREGRRTGSAVSCTQWQRDGRTLLQQECGVVSISSW